jgi:hypothetical protein
MITRIHFADLQLDFIAPKHFSLGCLSSHAFWELSNNLVKILPPIWEQKEWDGFLKSSSNYCTICSSTCTASNCTVSCANVAVFNHQINYRNQTEVETFRLLEMSDRQTVRTSSSLQILSMDPSTETSQLRHRRKTNSRDVS